MKISKKHHGSIEDMLKAVNSKLTQLQDSDTVDSSTDVVKADNHVVDEEKYVDNVMSMVDAALTDATKESNLSWNWNKLSGRKISLIVMNEGDVTEYTIPYDDLTFSNLKEDFNTIMKAIQLDGQVSEKSSEVDDDFDVMSSTSVSAANKVDTDDDAAVDSYINMLTQLVDAKLYEVGLSEHIVETEESEEGILTITIPDNAFPVEMIVEHSDVNWDWEKLDKDADRIVNEVLAQVSSTTEDTDVYTSTSITANRADRFFGEVAAKKYGNLISEKLKDKKISKRKDKANEPGGLIYESNEIGIDMWELLEALEGMCHDGRVREVDDSTYLVIGGEPHPVRSLFGAENIYSQANVVDWLSEHETAYNDACNYFHTDNLEDVAPADLEDWISEHDQLWGDYCNFFDIEACNNITASEAMYLDPDGNMFGKPRARYSFREIKRYWDEEHNGDPVLMQFNSFDDWFNACESDGTIVEIDEYSHGRKFQDVGGGFGTEGDILDEDDIFEYYQSNREYDPSLVEYDSYDDWINDSINNGWLSVIDSCDAVNCSIELTDDMKEKVWDTDDRHNTSNPVSGDWATEFGDTTGYRYLLRHGWGPGTIPRDVEVLDHVEKGYKDIILINRKLTPDELNEYDIIVLDDSGKATPAVNASKSVKAFEDTDISSSWKELASKSVPDSDGFMTDYTLYESTSDDNEYKYICMFGDKDIYTPDEGYADWSGDSLTEAEDWFSNYTGLDDEEEL